MVGPGDEFLFRMAPLLGRKTLQCVGVPEAERDEDFSLLFAIAETDISTDELTVTFRKDLLRALVANKPTIPLLRKSGYDIKSQNLDIILEDTEDWLYTRALSIISERKPETDGKRANRMAALLPEIPVVRPPKVSVLEELAWSFNIPLVPWYERAECLAYDTEDFYPVNGGMTPEADGACAVCTVRRECEVLSIKNPDLRGIWANTSEMQRGLDIPAAVPNSLLDAGDNVYLRGHLTRRIDVFASLLEAEQTNNSLEFPAHRADILSDSSSYAA